MNAPDYRFYGLMAVILALCAGIWMARDPDASRAGPGREVVLLASAAELPEAVVRLVRNTPAAQREAVVHRLLSEIARNQSSGSLPFVVAGISREFPALAPAAVSAAHATQPEVLVPCIRAAVAAAPSQAGLVVAEFIRRHPGDFPVVAMVAARQAPEQGEAILQAVAQAVPPLKPAMDAALAAQPHRPVDVRLALVQAETVAAQWMARVQPAPGDMHRAEQDSASAADAAPNSVSHAAFPALEWIARESQVNGGISFSESAAVRPVSASVWSQSPPRFVSPAALQPPSPKGIKEDLGDLGPGDARAYSRP